jgi:hypothetical protein
MIEKIICFRIAWMRDYEGVKNDDIPIGAGSWVKDHKDGGEVCNFLKVNNKYYGYVRVQRNKNIAIERIGSKITDNRIDNILVIMFARDPHFGGQYIVGWYNNATLYRKLQELSNNKRLNHTSYFCVSKPKDVLLINPQYRFFKIPDDGPGQSNIWYLNEYNNKKYIEEVINYINNPDLYFKTPKKKKGYRNIDFIKRQQVEIKAMEKTDEFFSIRGYKVSYVHKEKLGWDLEVTKAGKKYYIEVKGLSNDLEQFELTPNEYSKSKDLVNMYKICVVDNALNNRSNLNIFSYSKTHNSWICDSGIILNIKEKTGAVLIKKN